MKNKILAIPAAPAAIPPKPNTAAIMAKIIKVTVQRNIINSFRLVSDHLLISTIQISGFEGRKVDRIDKMINSYA
jgi:hypothetical protein